MDDHDVDRPERRVYIRPCELPVEDDEAIEMGLALYDALVGAQGDDEAPAQQPTTD